MSASGEALSVLPGATNKDKLEELCKLTYKAQTVWFMNGFWDKIEDDAEKLWDLVHLHAKFDLQEGANGSGLDELNAHRILESLNETQTVRELRQKLRQTGAIGEKDRPKTVPITHVLLFKYGVDWETLVNASQGDNSAEIAEAQRQLEAVQAAFQESEARATEAAAALAEAESTAAEAKATEEAAKQREAEAKEAEAPFKAAQEEVEAALAELKAQEEEYNGKIEDCKKRSESGGVVTRNKAKNELAQLLAEDPLPLRRAKITLEAANKRADKARAPFLAAREKAEQARRRAKITLEAANKRADKARAPFLAAREKAEQARAASEQAKQAADEALAAAEKALGEAEAYLEEVKSKAGSGGKGALWWIERELHEQKKYLPESKGGIKK
eukprot:CAMPEP_0201560276 /NCGR_PEP_ID=MMETSP0173_2-20130828/78187_1 /ASSEMBLY_ACC=CAM_ASM_000268 /TAXON_ID=218659 /ORGANISM="Vexillifera sp., Strain DIVA3 564/2" /LENGTH=387 /DNA_ID=CAMNT_0047974721 /DNA_START=43 /DNA_END=1207 /DNA_ORIENTATION=-